ncbi:MAG: NusG domain II-containing protein, partial [Anaerococcus vaginalis]
MNKIKKADVLVIFLIIISSFLIYFFTNKLPKEDNISSKKLVITVDGKIYKEVELNEDTNLDLDIDTKYGKNEVHINNGEV